MTDRELLELSAKAAGIDAQWLDQDEADYESEHEGLWLKGARGPDNSRYWNPLTNDGDALRLSVKLQMEVCHADEAAHANYAFAGYERIHYAIEPHGADECAATRRAIVRAAAASEQEAQ